MRAYLDQVDEEVVEEAAAGVVVEDSGWTMHAVCHSTRGPSAPQPHTGSVGYPIIGR